MYPENDHQFEDREIKKVEPASDNSGFYAGFTDGWSFFIPAADGIVPAPGGSARLYGKGVGYTVRGLFVDGKKVFYRTESEHQTYCDNQTYGESAEEWLRRWDADETVWSVVMGGLGPGYEQAIQITVAEYLRELLSAPKAWSMSSDEPLEKQQERRNELRKKVMIAPCVERLGLSGAQDGAAFNVAWCLFTQGPVAALKKVDSKRLIQVRKLFPQGD